MAHICDVAHLMLEICNGSSSGGDSNNTNNSDNSDNIDSDTGHTVQSYDAYTAYTQVTYHKLLWLVASGSVTSTAVPSVDHNGDGDIDIDNDIDGGEDVDEI